MSATTATTPGTLYQTMRRMERMTNPTNPAKTPACAASAPSDGPIDCVETSSIGTGKAPEFKRPTRVFASSGLKSPVMTACPPEITLWTTGVEIGAPSKYMATIFPILSSVICSKSSEPSLSNSRVTVGEPKLPVPDDWPKSSPARFRYLPVKGVAMKYGSSMVLIGIFSPARIRSSMSLNSASIFSFSGPSGRSTLNSSSGVWPIMAVASLISVIPGKSMMSRFSPWLVKLASWTWTFVSATPKRFTRLSTTSRSALIESLTSFSSTSVTSAL